MLTTEFISKSDAARMASVSRVSIRNWISAGRIVTDARGRIPAREFLRDHAQHRLVSMLHYILDTLPPAALPGILAECLTPEYLVAITNLFRARSTASDVAVEKRNKKSKKRRPGGKASRGNVL
jgi:hypothetical protein